MLIDVSSDNVTQPTDAMRDAMRSAQLAGYGTVGDPSTKRLEELAAEIFGKEAALLLPSGTQANLVAILCQAQRSQEVILGSDSHIYEQELGGAGAVAGVMLKTWPGEGFPSPEALQGVVSPLFRFPTTASPKPVLICFENTHNASGGTLFAAEQMRGLCAVAREANLRIHLDGARIFNAAAALGCRVLDLAAGVDTVMFSLDKGLSAPYGAVLCGPADTIAEARRWRRLLGGHARQAGLLAAAGVVALGEMRERIGEDNVRAQSIGTRLHLLDGVRVQPYPVPSNLVMLDLRALGAAPRLFVEQLEVIYGVRAHIYGRHLVRFAIHRHIGPDEADAIVAAVAGLVRQIKPSSVNRLNTHDSHGG